MLNPLRSILRGVINNYDDIHPSLLTMTSAKQHHDDYPKKLQFITSNFNTPVEEDNQSHLEEGKGKPSFSSKLVMNSRTQ